MKKSIILMAVTMLLTVSSSSFAQLTTTTMKLVRGSGATASLINFTGTTTAGTSTYTWPQAPSATRPLQSSSAGVLSFAPIDVSNNTDQITGTLAVANGGTGAATLSANALLLGNGTSPVQSVSLDNNQLLVGNTSGAPTARNLVGSGGINVVVDATNITLSSAVTGSAAAVGQATYTSGGGQTVVVTPGIAVAPTSRILVTVTDATGGNLISAGVIAQTATTFTVSVSTDVDSRINWYISNP